MAKIPRKLMKQFGSAAGVDQIAQFGSLFAGTPALYTGSADPDAVQGLANWLTGWFGAAIGGNSPAIEDMNAAFFVMAYQLSYIFQAGVAEWNTDTIYYTGSLVNDGGVLYKSLTDDNTGNAVTDITNWQPFLSSKVVTTAIDYISSIDDYVIATAACVVTLPTAVGKKGRSIDVINTSTAAADVQIATTSSQTIGGRASLDIVLRRFNNRIKVTSDGANWQISEKLEHQCAISTNNGTINGASLSFQAAAPSLTLGIGEWELTGYAGLVGAGGSATIFIYASTGFYQADGANTTSAPTSIASQVDGPTSYANMFNATAGIFQAISGSNQSLSTPLTTRVIVTSGTQTVFFVPCVGYGTASTANWYSTIIARRIS